MPTYVYKCDTCGKQFEQFQSFKDAPLEECPCDQRARVRRVFQPVGIVFKGSGWYVTDSRAKNPTSTAPSTTTTDAATNTTTTASQTPATATPASSSSSDTTES